MSPHTLYYTLALVSDIMTFFDSLIIRPWSVDFWVGELYLGRCRTVLRSGCSSYPDVCDGVCGGVGRMTSGSSLAPSPSLPRGSPSHRAVQHTHIGFYTFFTDNLLSGCLFLCVACYSLQTSNIIVSAGA